MAQSLYRHPSLATRHRTTIGPSPPHQPWQRMAKVPTLTGYFWLLKLITTALGESLSDYMVRTFNPYIAVSIGAIVLLITLAWQFSIHEYRAATYWSAALGVSISGTMGADVMHVGFGIPYAASALGYGIALAIIFSIWYKSEKTLSIHSIFTLRREAFYWAAILATFALGTAMGDLTAYTLHLGYIVSAIIFAVIFVIPAIGWRQLSWNPILSFWWAYIVTRPLGASIPDWAGKPHELGGLGLGGGLVSVTLFTLLAVTVGYVSITGRDRPAKLH